MSVEKGYGPVNFGTTQVELCDGLSELSSFEVMSIKVERVTVAIVFLFLLGATVYNIYAYLWKSHMYSSYPLVLGYVLLTVYSAMGVVYELYMGFACGKNDCFTHLLVSIMPEYRVYFYSEKHHSYITQISIFWKLRQQLLWGLGMC